MQNIKINMDAYNSTLNVPPRKVLDSEVSVVNTESRTINLVSSEAGRNDPVVSSPNIASKRIIRKITPLDPKKLQQAGLDRKIAEALSKQKFHQNSKPLSRISNALISTSKASSTGDINSIVSKPATVTNFQELTSAKDAQITKKIKPPKITVTGPHVLTEVEKQDLASLNPHERLYHVKHLLNKKLLQKKTTETNDNPTTFQHLKPPRPPPPPPPPHLYLAKPPNDAKSPQKLFCVLKEPADISTQSTSVKQSITPQKIPQDYVTKAVDSSNRKCLNKEITDIPKASIKAGNSLTSNTTQNYKQSQDVFSTKTSYSNISQQSQNCQAECIKQQKIMRSKEIPKASIKTSQFQQQYSKLPHKQMLQTFEVSEVAPTKMAVVSIPNELPQPAVGSFKKPYPMVNTAHYDQYKIGPQTEFVFTDYANSKQSTTSLKTSNLPNDAAITSVVPNCLIVLENKILSQDEMIDLTDLRLSASKVNTPGFVNHHKPIPEVVIKQECTEEYPITELSYPLVNTKEVPESIAGIKTQNTPRLPTVNMKNKIIINAQKLKLPPEQLADLAKKIKQKSTASTPVTKGMNHLKVQNVRILNTKSIDSRIIPNKQAAYVFPNNTEMVGQIADEMPDKLIQNKQLYIDVDKQDHNYYSKQIQQSLKTIAEPAEKKKQFNFDHSLNKNPSVKDDSSDKSQTFLVENRPDTTTLQIAENSTSSKGFCESAVEIFDEPLQSEDSFSAVDFIAALGNTNSLAEETCLEPSTEELNLNASCAIQSYPPSICPKTSTPKTKVDGRIKDKLLNSQQTATIVIESSDGPETVLTEKTTQKGIDLSVPTKLQTLEVFHNTVIREMEIQKSSETLSTTDSVSKRGNINVTNKPPAVNRNPKSVSATPTKFGDPKLFDNKVLCKVEESSERLTANLTETDNRIEEISEISLENANEPSLGICKLLLDPPIEPKSISLTNIKPDEDINEDMIKNNISHKLKSCLKPQLPENMDIDINITSKEAKNQQTISSEPVELDDISIAHSDSMNVSKAYTNPEHLTQSGTISNTLLTSNTKMVDSKPDSSIIEVNTATSISSDNKNIIAQVTETSKTTAISSNTTVTSKRISKFKKGKINLVQRNKTGQVTNKPLPEVQKNQAKKINSDNEVHKTSNTLLSESGKENFEQVKQEGMISKQNEENIEDPNLSCNVQEKKHTIEIVDNVPDNYEVIEHALIGDKMGEPKASIKTNNSSNTPEKNFTESLIIPKASIKTVKSVEKNLNCKPLISDNLEIPEASVRKGKTFEQNLKSPQKSLDKASVSDNMSILKSSIEREVSPQQLLSTPSKNDQHIQLTKSDIKVPVVSSDKVTIEQQESQEYINELTPTKVQVTEKSKQLKECSENMETPVIETAQTQDTQVDNLVQEHTINISNKSDNLTKESIAILYTMKSAKVPLIDIVKHSPTKPGECYPVIPFNNMCSTAGESCPEGIKELLKELKNNNNDNDEHGNKLYQPEQQIENVISEDVRKSLTKVVDEEKVSASQDSCKTDSQASEIQTQSPATSFQTRRRRYSTRPLISDDDLEFLPENAEVKFRLTKSKHNEKNKECILETTPLTSSLPKRRHRLHSRSLELELTRPSLPLTKRNRYYSQTLETNVTITFDALKSKTCKPTETEESHCDSTQDSNTTATPTKQRKKMRKTIEDIKKSRKSHSDTDSEDDNCNYDCVMKDCEESSEFLGFEEISNSSSLRNPQQDVNESGQEAKTKHGTLKNWLTTGKAISPTFGKAASKKRLRRDDDDGLPGPSSKSFALHDTKKLARFDLCSHLNEETDITDDTSPADDDEEIRRQIPTSKKLKRDMKNAADIKDQLMKNKKTKFDNPMEHSFIKPRNLEAKAKHSDTDIDCGAKNIGTSQKKRLKSLMNSEKSGTDTVRQVCKESAHRKLQNKTNSIKKSNDGAKSTEKHSNRTATDSVGIGKTQSEQLGSKYKTRNSKNEKDTDKDTNADSGSERGRVTKRPQSKNKTEDKIVDICVISEADGQQYDHSNSKDRETNDSAENLDIPQQQEIVNKSENMKDKRETSEKNLKLVELKAAVTKLPVQTELCAKKNNQLKENITVDKIASEITCQSPENVINRRRRGRPKAQPKKTQSTLSAQTSPTSKSKMKNTDVTKPVISNSSEDEGPLPSAKKRTTKKKLKIEDSDCDSISTPLNKTQDTENVMVSLTPIATPSLGTTTNEPSTPTVGRKRKSNAESNFNPRLLLITKREQLDTDEVITHTTPGSGAIQCGLCLGRTQPAKWKLHLAEHYGIGWKAGEEKLHVENRSVVLNKILNYLKDTGSSGLPCRMCKKVYRSALGLLMHIEACGAQTIRVICEFCKREYAKTTLPIHIRSCYARTSLETKSSDDKLDENNKKKDEVFGNSGRLKRNSTIKAETKLKALGAELENVPDNVKTENPDIDPKSRIKYVPPPQGDFTSKWSNDIKRLGQASCLKARCKFTSNDIKILSEHIKSCKHIKSGYFCNFCRQKVFKSENEAIEHVIKNHQKGRSRKKSDDSDCDLKTDDEQSSDDNDLSEGVDESQLDDDVPDEEDDCDEIYDNNKKSYRRYKSRMPYSRNLNQSTNPASRKSVFDGRFTDLNKEVLRKWKRFLSSNYSCEPLYAEFTTQYSVINNKSFNKYLPTQTVSMKFNFETKPGLNIPVGLPEKNIEWSELKRYESINNETNTYFFLGAPVKLCSWLPLPSHLTEQYLAVVYRQEMFKYIKFSQPKQHHSIVLILKVTQSNKIPELNIHYGFIISDGPVHHLSFLPSGGYDESSNRLGLVAVGTVTSDIKVYSLPLNIGLSSIQENEKSNENITLIDVKPKFLLTLDVLNKNEEQEHVVLNPQCLQICWSEYSGHQHIFAGFSNGFIGIWDINNDPQQNLNRFVIDDIINYVPLNYFYVGEKRVKCFALHYDTCGPRWLAVASAYRKLVIYDFKNYMQPVIMKEETNKNILQSMDWCPLWETFLYSYCDAIPNNGRCVTAVNPTNVMFPQNKLDIMVCGVTQVHYTPATNTCVTALNNGDILFLDTKELHYECPLNKKFGERRMLYAMDIKQLNGQNLVRLPKGSQKNDKVPSDWVMFDDDYKEKYGLIFNPIFKLKENDRKAYLSEDRYPPVNMIPFMRINTLRCNLNQNGKHLIALGYENGFLRLVYFNKEAIFGN